MAQVGSITTAKVLGILTAQSGLNASIGEVSAGTEVRLSAVGATQIVGQNVAMELVERSAGAHYPALYVYCERLKNTLKEKFRTFSGQAQMAIEVRATQDRLEGLERRVQLYVDALTRVLDQHRGSWGDGVYYPGTYEVAFGPTKHGGKNFLQTAKVTFELEVGV